MAKRVNCIYPTSIPAIKLLKMTGNFVYHGGHLFAEDVALASIAEQHGTPSYVYSRHAIERNYMAYTQALQHQNTAHLVCYATKANANLAVLDIHVL